MNELIKIRKSIKTGNPVVSARDLHGFLEIGKDFSTWIKSKIKKYGLVENIDYARIYYDINGKQISVTENGELALEKSQWVFKIEFALTLSCAKELAMVQNNEKGRQARQYFIEVEKMFNELKQEKERKSVVLYTMTEVAEKLQLTDYYGKIGRNALYNILYHYKIVNEKNKPLQKYVKRGYFTEGVTPRVTEEGLKWLNQKFCVEKTSDNTELKQQIQELKENQEILVQGIACVVETMLFNKGGSRTEDQNRKAINDLNRFLESAKVRKALN